MADPKKPVDQDDADKHREDLLDEALDQSFPASDPPQQTEPGPPQKKADR
jgi:hypothetical protein